MPLRVHLLSKSQNEKGELLPRRPRHDGFQLRDPGFSLQGQQRHIVRCLPGHAFSIRMKEPLASCQANDVLQTFLLSLVNGNNIYLAMDKQVHWKKGAQRPMRSSESLWKEDLYSITNLLIFLRPNSFSNNSHSSCPINVCRMGRLSKDVLNTMCALDRALLLIF